jgi:hypothetical protein
VEVDGGDERDVLGVERGGLEAEDLGGVPQPANGEVDVQAPVLGD